MSDRELVARLFERSEAALEQLVKQYGGQCTAVIRRIVSDERDTEECINDVWLAVWNSIPPQCPDCLGAYVCRLARNIAINRYRYNSRSKRDNRFDIMLSELGDCIPAREEDDGQGELAEMLSRSLTQLDAVSRVLFVRRYFYMETVAELAARYGMRENAVSVKLFRARKKLKKLLEKERSAQ